VSSTIKLNVLFQPQYILYIHTYTYRILGFSFFVITLTDTCRHPRLVGAGGAAGVVARQAEAIPGGAFTSRPHEQCLCVLPGPCSDGRHGRGTSLIPNTWWGPAPSSSPVPVWQRAWVAAGPSHCGFTAARWRLRSGVTVSWSEALMLYLIYCEGRVKIYFSIRNSHQCLEGRCVVLWRLCYASFFISFLVVMFFIFFSWEPKLEVLCWGFSFQ